jgi:hypothetical protein
MADSDVLQIFEDHLADAAEACLSPGARQAAAACLGPGARQISLLFGWRSPNG